MFNTITLTGNLGKDFELRGKDDRQYAIGSVCALLNAKLNDDGWQNEQLWLGLRADGFLAKKVAKLQKGQRVMFSGKLRNFQSDDEEFEPGEVGYLYVQLTDIELIGALPKDEEEAPKSKKPRSKKKTEAPSGAFEE